MRWLQQKTLRWTSTKFTVNFANAADSLNSWALLCSYIQLQVSFFMRQLQTFKSLTVLETD